MGFRGERCCLAWLSVLVYTYKCVVGVVKHTGLDANKELEKPGMPYLMQIHEALLSTSPA